MRRAPRRADPRGHDQVLDRERHPVQPPPPRPPLRRPRLGHQRRARPERDDGVDRRIDPLDPVERRRHHLAGPDRPRGQRRRQRGGIELGQIHPVLSPVPSGPRPYHGARARLALPAPHRIVTIQRGYPPLPRPFALVIAGSGAITPRTIPPHPDPPPMTQAATAALDAAPAAFRRVRHADRGADGADRALDRRDAPGAAADARRVRHRRRQPPAARPDELRRRLRRRPALPRALERLARPQARAPRRPRRLSRSPPSSASPPRASTRCSPPASCRASPTPRRASSRWRWCATPSAGGAWPR